MTLILSSQIFIYFSRLASVFMDVPVEEVSNDLSLGDLESLGGVPFLNIECR